MKYITSKLVCTFWYQSGGKPAKHKHLGTDIYIYIYKYIYIYITALNIYINVYIYTNYVISKTIIAIKIKNETLKEKKNTA